MEKLRVVDYDKDIIILESKDKTCRCTISNLRFHDTDPVLHTEVAWTSKGKYTNGRRKKMVARTVVSLLHSAIVNLKKISTQSCVTEN